MVPARWGAGQADLAGDRAAGPAGRRGGGTHTMSLTLWSRLWSGPLRKGARPWCGRRRRREGGCPLQVEVLEDRTTPSPLGLGTAWGGETADTKSVGATGGGAGAPAGDAPRGPVAGACGINS